MSASRCPTVFPTDHPLPNRARRGHGIYRSGSTGGAALGSVLALVWPLMASAGDPVPDFKLVDVNTNSIRYNAVVSPRDYILQVSGYYFCHAG